MIEVLKIASNPIKSPADITDPGIAYPDVEIDINDFNFFDCLYESERAIAKKIVKIPTETPNIKEFINKYKLSIRLILKSDNCQ